MEAAPKVHRHRHRRTSSRRRNEEANSADRQNGDNQHQQQPHHQPRNQGVGAPAAVAPVAQPQVIRPQPAVVVDRSNNIPEQPSVLVNGHEPPPSDESCDGDEVAALESERSPRHEDQQPASGRSASGQGTDSQRQSVEQAHGLQRGIMGFMDREIKTTNSTGTGGAVMVSGGKKTQSLSDPQASPAQRSTRSRSSMEKSPRRKRSKSESRRRRERKLIAAGEMEVRQANETLMRYLKQCSEMNDASLSGELEIDHNFEERRVHRKTKSQRDKRGHVLNKSNGKLYTSGGLSSILRDLTDDIVPVNGEIYNPFTPVVSPTEGPPTRIDKMFIQTSSGYRAVDHSFYQNAIGDDPESNKNEISSSVNLSCAVQRIWILISNICHGLLGGLALAHLLFISTSQPYDWSEGAMRHYSSFAEIYANTFYCLAIICMVSIFDRMDICHIDISNAAELISFRWIIITMIYIATIILTLCAESMDEKLYLTNYNITILAEEMENNQVLSVWNSLSIARSVGAIIGWIMIGLSPTDDLLFNHLLEMEKYQLTNN